MVTVYAGRYTTSIDGPFVAFLIGFRINRLLAVRKWFEARKNAYYLFIIYSICHFWREL